MLDAAAIAGISAAISDELTENSNKNE